MNHDELLALPFHEYMARRTKFAIDRVQRDNLIDLDAGSIALLQALWAREYWVNRNLEAV